MKTRNRILFHCLCCGRLVRSETDEPVPFCCDQSMINAAAETVTEATEETTEEFVREFLEPAEAHDDRDTAGRIPR